MAMSHDQMLYSEWLALNEPDSQSMYIVTWRYIPATIVAVEKE